MKSSYSRPKHQGSYPLKIAALKTSFTRLAVPLIIIALNIPANYAYCQPGKAALIKNTFLSEEEIKKILVDRIDVMHKAVGMVVGITSPNGRRIISYGQMQEGDPRTINGETVFEIGSITKLFTALLLADMVERQEISLNDPIIKYLPKGTNVPESKGQLITLLDLATHTSGLPFMPTNMGIDLTRGTSYSKEEIHKLSCQYTDKEFYQFLASYGLTHDIGSQWEYSNIDYGLLGKALANRSGLSYEKLLQKRITEPLNMSSTSIRISGNMKKRLGPGHDSQLKPTPEVCLPAMEATGSLRSTTNDLLNFLEIFTGQRKSSLAPAVQLMLNTHRKGPGFDQALGWWIITLSNNIDKVVLFGGETLGYTSTIAYDPMTKTGVVVLTNSDQTDGGLGMHILRSSSPVETSESVKKLKERLQLTLDLKTLDLYAGIYQTEQPNEIITIERHTDSLVMKSSTTPPEGVLLFAENATSF